MSLPSDRELQRLSDDALQRLWSQRPRYLEGSQLDWLRVAKEVRYRKRHSKHAKDSPWTASTC